MMANFGGYLLLPDPKLAIFFSEKSASSSFMHWYIFQMGLDEIFPDIDMKCVQGIHKVPYLFQKTMSYRDLDKEFRKDLDSWTKIKLVRNPFYRTVSSFFMSFGLYPHRSTFREFLSSPLAHFHDQGDPHLSRQVSEAELSGALKIDRVLRVDVEFMQHLSDLEIEFSLKRSVHEIKENVKRTTSEKSFNEGAADYVFTSLNNVEDGEFDFNPKRMTQEGPVLPKHESFLEDENIRQLIVEIFREDFEHYGYETHSVTNETGSSQAEKASLKKDSGTSSPSLQKLGSVARKFDHVLEEIDASDKVLVFGGGDVFAELYFFSDLRKKNISAVLDSGFTLIDFASPNRELFENVPVIGMHVVSKMEFDKVLICSIGSIEAMKEQLLANGVNRGKILHL